MAKTENSQESGGSENALTKTPTINEHSNDDSVIHTTGGECVLLKTNCTHLNAAINFSQIRKAIQKNGGLPPVRCVTCEANPTRGDGSKIEDLILCMNCGECNCTDHVLRHYKTPRSDLHLIYVNVNDWNVKCFECDSIIPTDVGGRLSESINYLRNTSIRNKSKSVVEVTKINAPVTTNTAIESTSSTASAYRNSDTHSSLAVMIGTRPTSSVLPPRGLCNLGNTCFFNSVLQCLARTPFLVEVLMEMKEPGEKVIMKLEPHPPIEVELQEKWGPVTENLVSTLKQITTLSGNAFSPAHLLDSLRTKHRQFMGFNQHDAHELLRTLLDCVKNEDMRRYRVELLRHLGLSRKTNPDEVDERKKAQAKEMDKKLTEIVNIRPDPVFRGFTVSANTCIKCSHKSEIPESFLDLSLPVSFLRLQPLSINRRKNDFGEKAKSKNQLKKERKQARKNKKLSSKMKRRYAAAAVEDQKNKNSEKMSIEIRDVNESGYSSGKASSPAQTGSDNAINNENSNEILAEALDEINATPLNDSTEDYGVHTIARSVEGSVHSPSCKTPYCEVPTVDTLGVMLENRLDSNDVASTSSYESTRIERGNNELASGSEQRRFVEPTIVTSPSDSSSSGCRLPNAFCSNASKLSNSVGGGSSSSGGDDDDDIDDDNEADDNDAGDSNEEDEFVEDNILEIRGLCATLQPPTGDDEENSIWACLREYTKCEVLTGNNKVVCEKCTKEANKYTGEKKQVYRNFTKQLLIKSPPPVLILHLKRFEAKGAFSFRKVDTSISFPLTLDIGSFCSATCERLLYPEQKNILYSLYGIVEHSGSLNAGHYVAYVKVRNTNKHSYRRQFLPKGKYEQTESLSDKHLEQMMNELKNEEKQWYNISDTMVRPIAEEDILRKQAYLLFYERIW